MNRKKSFILMSVILVIVVLVINYYNDNYENGFKRLNEHGLVKVNSDEVFDYYRSKFPDLQQAIDDAEILNLNIKTKIGDTDSNLYVDSLWYDLKGEKILLMYHIDKMYENRSVGSIIRTPIDDNFNYKSTISYSLSGKLKYNGQGAKVDDQFYGILGYDVLRNDNDKILKSDKIEITFDLRLDYKDYHLYNIFVDL